MGVEASASKKDKSNQTHLKGEVLDKTLLLKKKRKA